MKYDNRATLFGNFMHREIAKSSTAARMLINNIPPDEVIDSAKLLAENCLQPIRGYFGIPFSPQSWYRCEALERALTGRAFEYWAAARDLSINGDAWGKYFALKSHPKGEAADIELVGISNDELFEWCSENLVFDQLIREFSKPGDPSSGWVHISYKAEGNRGNILRLG